MSNPISAHPTEANLRAYADGRLDSGAVTEMSQHLNACAACRQRLPMRSPVAATGQTETAHGPGHEATTADHIPPELLGLSQYEVQRRLGGGGMGVVYLAYNKYMRRLEVLKIINKDLLEKRGVVERFLREIGSAGQLAHDNVVRAHAAYPTGHLLVFAMEYVEGEDLAQLVAKSGPLPIDQACNYAYQAAQGLQHAHEKGMVHRDIKPHNLILLRIGQENGVRPVVKILDFGLAKAVSEEPTDGGLTDSHSLLGTPHYIAPEQARDAQKADIRADIYSLGCTLYHLLAGRPPFRADSMTAILLAHQSAIAPPLDQVRPDVPAELARIVARMMAREPDDRYQTPAEVACVLVPFFQRGAAASVLPPSQPPPASAKPPPLAPTTLDPVAESPLVWPWVLAGVIGLSAFVLLLWFALGPGRAEGPPTTPPVPPSPPSRFTNSLGMTLVRIEPGFYLRGSTKEQIDLLMSQFPNLDRNEFNDEQPQKRIEISRPFYLGAHEVTVGQFRQFVNASRYQTEAERNNAGSYVWNGKEWKLNPKTNWRNPGFAQSDDHPVTCVSHNDARAFIVWLNQQQPEAGRTYRLPTEAEWEYACRAGTRGLYGGSDDPEDLVHIANVADASFQKQFPNRTASIRGDDGYVHTAPVGKFQANDWGLHDMTGNVWEWCDDYYYAKFYKRPETKDPHNTKEALGRVFRGGCLSNEARYCRSADRSKYAPEGRFVILGLRLAAVQAEP